MSTPQDRPQPKRLSDPRELKALAHPLRMRLVVELTTRGSARAVDLAKTIGEPANSVSFHLRQLARYGLIVEDTTHAGDGRERWWQVASSAGFRTDMGELRKLPGGRQAVGSLEHLTQEIAQATMTVAFSDIDESDGPKTWFNDFGLSLSAAELTEFLDAQWELTTRWMERSRELSQSADGVERHTFVGFSFGAPVNQVLGAEESAGRAGGERAGRRQ